MKKLENIHPGEILKEEFLDPMEITAYRLSKETFIPQTRISEIIKKKRRITADTALRLSKYFGTSAKGCQSGVGIACRRTCGIGDGCHERRA